MVVKILPINCPECGYIVNVVYYVKTYLNIFYVHRPEDDEFKPIVCTNCGHKFRARIRRL
jgi:transcription elongation factor Elf1